MAAAAPLNSVVVIGGGSLGDILPLTHLACALSHSGIPRVTLVSYGDAAVEAQRLLHPFSNTAGSAPPFDVIASLPTPSLARTILPTAEAVKGVVYEIKPDVIVHNLLAMEAFHAAEALGVPVVAVSAFAPRYQPPQGFWAALEDAHPRLYRAIMVASDNDRESGTIVDAPSDGSSDHGEDTDSRLHGAIMAAAGDSCASGTTVDAPFATSNSSHDHGDLERGSVRAERNANCDRTGGRSKVRAEAACATSSCTYTRTKGQGDAAPEAKRGRRTGKIVLEPLATDAGLHTSVKTSLATQSATTAAAAALRSASGHVDRRLVTAWMWRLFLEDQGEARERIFALPPCPFTTQRDETPRLPEHAPPLLINLAPAWQAAGLPGLQELPAAACLTGPWECSCCTSTSPAVPAAAAALATAAATTPMPMYAAACAFLQRAPRPRRGVLVTFGSMERLGLLTAAMATHFITNLLAYAQHSATGPNLAIILQLACDGPLQRAWATQYGGRKEHPNVFLTAESLPHAELLATGLIDVVVHHAGAGIVATCSGAGVGQVPCPFHFDQHDWTAALVRAGVCSGPFQLEQTSQDGDCLAHAIDSTLFRAGARSHLRDSLLADRGPGVDHAVNVVHAVFNMRAQQVTV